MLPDVLLIAEMNIPPAWGEGRIFLLQLRLCRLEGLVEKEAGMQAGTWVS